MMKIDIAEKFSLFSDHRRPNIVAQLNGPEVRLVKFKGEFICTSMRTRMSSSSCGVAG
jgi:hypothetical protein